MLDEMERAVTVFGHALEILVNSGFIKDLNSSLDCHGTDDVKWPIGERLFKYLHILKSLTLYETNSITILRKQFTT